MKCLCCGKPLTDKENMFSGWHQHCVRRFFGTDRLPEIDLGEDALLSYATETVFKGLTVPGVQRKMSLHLSSQDTPRLTLVDYPTGYILKPQTEEYRSVPEAEDLAMRIAELLGIKTVPHALMRVNDTFAYITKRIDRKITGKRRLNVEKFAMEDFCQLDGRLTTDKYRGSYERCSKIIEKYSVRKGIDIAELFMRLIGFYITGNSDMHLKNFSLIEMNPGSSDFVLSAAYDLLPVKLLLPEDNEELALTINGKKSNLRRSDFVKFAGYCGMTETAAENIIRKLLSKEHEILKQCDESYLSDDMKETMKGIVSSRFDKLR